MYIQLPAVICPYIINPFFSSSSKCCQLAQLGTSWLLLIKTLGESLCVFRIPTGLPDWINSDSSFSNTFNAAIILSSASKFLAAFPLPPYTIRSSGRSATSGSRLLSNILNAASCIQPLQLSLLPVGVLYLMASYRFCVSVDIIFFLNHEDTVSCETQRTLCFF